MAHSRRRRVVIGAALGGVCAAVAWLLGLTAFMRTVELKTYDQRVQFLTDSRLANPDIILVSIDDASVRKLEPLVGRWPWPRLVHAQLIEFLSRAPARVIAYDILFTERDRRTFDVAGETWTGEESDRALADAVARSGNVVVVADVTSADPLDAAGQPEASAAIARSLVAPDARFEGRLAVVPPFPELAAASAALGHNLLVLDPDGPVRRSVPAVRAGRDAGALPSLGLATALRAWRADAGGVRIERDVLRVGPARAPLVDARVTDAAGRAADAKRTLIRFTGPAALGGTPTYAAYSFYDLFYAEQQIEAGEKPVIAPGVFRDKIVFVGTTAAGLHDVFTVPFAAGKMPGAQVHANVVDNLLSQRFMRPSPGWVTAALVLVSAVLVGIFVLVLGQWRAVAATVIVAGGVIGIAVSAFGAGVWTDVARPALGVALSLLAGTAYQYFVEGREKRLVKQVFSRFVSRDVFDQLMADPAGVSLGGARREMSVLFSDIRGFTTFTERGRAEEVVGQLNEYFSAMVPVVFEHRGTVDKFVGDMVMALFGAPLDDPDHADHAVRAALAMLEHLGRANARWEAAGRPRLDIGIGINSGDMVAGNIGSESIMSYTVIGDAVNLGARLESLNKEYGTHIIISGFTRARLKGRYDMRPLGTVVVKGKSEPVEIFEVRPGVSPDTAGA